MSKQFIRIASHRTNQPRKTKCRRRKCVRQRSKVRWELDKSVYYDLALKKLFGIIYLNLSSTSLTSSKSSSVKKGYSSKFRVYVWSSLFFTVSSSSGDGGKIGRKKRRALIFEMHAFRALFLTNLTLWECVYWSCIKKKLVAINSNSPICEKRVTTISIHSVSVEPTTKSYTPMHQFTFKDGLINMNRRISSSENYKLYMGL